MEQIVNIDVQLAEDDSDQPNGLSLPLFPEDTWEKEKQCCSEDEERDVPIAPGVVYTTPRDTDRPMYICSSLLPHTVDATRKMLRSLILFVLFVLFDLGSI
jgi:hypothetical protein